MCFVRELNARLPITCSVGVLSMCSGTCWIISTSYQMLRFGSGTTQISFLALVQTPYRTRAQLACSSRAQLPSWLEPKQPAQPLSWTLPSDAELLTWSSPEPWTTSWCPRSWVAIIGIITPAWIRKGSEFETCFLVDDGEVSGSSQITHKMLSRAYVYLRRPWHRTSGLTRAVHDVAQYPREINHRACNGLVPLSLLDEQRLFRLFSWKL